MVDISQGMDAAAMYEFDMNGVIVFRNALAPEHVAHLNELLGERESDALSSIDADEEKKYSSLESARYSGKARFPEHPAFLELMAYKPAIDILRVMLGDWFRLDHVRTCRSAAQLLASSALCDWGCTLRPGVRHRHGPCRAG